MRSKNNKSNPSRRATRPVKKSVTELMNWNRLPSESAVAFAAFRMYRDMNPVHRSLRRVAQRLGRHLSLVERWSSRHAWVQRTRARDEERHRLQMQAQEAEWIEQAKQHAGRLYRDRYRS